MYTNLAKYQVFLISTDSPWRCNNENTEEQPLGAQHRLHVRPCGEVRIIYHLSIILRIIHVLTKTSPTTTIIEVTTLPVPTESHNLPALWRWTKAFAASHTSAQLTIVLTTIPYWAPLIAQIPVLILIAQSRSLII